MRKVLAFGAALVALSVTADGAVASPLSACEVLRIPDAFKDKRVEVRGFLTDYSEYNGIVDAGCSGLTLPFWADHLPENDKAVEDSLAEVRRQGGRVLVTIVGTVKIRPDDVPRVYVLVDRYDNPQIVAQER